MSEAMDKMFDAACESAGVSQTGYAPWKDHLRAAIAAALAAAPTVEGPVWCSHHKDMCETRRRGKDCRSAGSAWSDDCIGPHRTLLIGPEVTT
jgi:hypothetical protein